MDISGLIIDCEETRFSDVVDALHSMAELELLRILPPSRIVCLVEAEGIDPSMDVSRRIWAIPGVAAINLTCHYHDVDGESTVREQMVAPTTDEGAVKDEGLRARD
jgi:nitrate reductase NapAB chaperone NapD